MLLIDFIKLVLILLLTIFAINTASKGLLHGLFALFIMFIFASYFVFKERIEFFLEKKGWEKFFWYESLANGGIKEAQIYRPLLDYEKQILNWQFEASGDKNLDLDRRSPVFRVVGNLLKKGRGEDEVAVVRGLEISKKNFPWQMYQVFSDYSDVAVEFSPFSKKVWDMYRLIGDKRNWYFHLPSESIKQIREGTKKVDLRAPFGSHNLREMKKGDIISYISDSKILLSVEITNVRYYKNLDEVVAGEGLNMIMPEADSIKDLEEYLKTLPSYLPRIKQYGVFALQVRPVS